MAEPRATYRWLIPTLIIAVFSSILAGSSARHLERLWDEQVDFDIAESLRRHPVLGESPALDASQMRLPMYVNALAFAVTGRDDLAASRSVSLVAGAATVVMTAALAAVLFGEGAAVLAALFLGLSPYFLSFARIAMTEGDIFFACFTTLSIYTFVNYLRRPTPWRWLLAVVALALALGSKFFAIFLFPVYVVLMTSSSQNRAAKYSLRRSDDAALNRIALGGLAVIVTTLAAVHACNRGGRTGSEWVGVCGWLIECVLCMAACARVSMSGAAPRIGIAGCMKMFALAVMLCCAMMPVHMTQPEIAVELLRRTLHWDHRLPLALWSDHLRLYAGIIMLKLTVPLGVLTAGALVYAGLREREDGRWRPCILAVIFYVVLLCFLPLRQTFYLMGVYPLMMIVLAAVVGRIWKGLRRGSLSRRLFAATTCGLILHLAYANYQSFPWYHLHGYATVGSVWMGRESRGYRNLIQTPSDGVEELIRWCESSPDVRAGSRVVSYLWEERIIESLLPAQPRYSFVPRGLSQESDAVPPGPSITDADFVLLHVNNVLGYGDRLPDVPDMTALNRDFVIVHTVRRGPIDVGWVYARKR